MHYLRLWQFLRVTPLNNGNWSTHVEKILKKCTSIFFCKTLRRLPTFAELLREVALPYTLPIIIRLSPSSNKCLLFVSCKSCTHSVVWLPHKYRPWASYLYKKIIELTNIEMFICRPVLTSACASEGNLGQLCRLCKPLMLKQQLGFFEKTFSFVRIPNTYCVTMAKTRDSRKGNLAKRHTHYHCVSDITAGNFYFCNSTAAKG